MKDWREKLGAFLQFNDQDILQNAGSVTKKVADALAEDKYIEFHQQRLALDGNKLGDIDEAIKKIEET